MNRNFAYFSFFFSLLIIPLLGSQPTTTPQKKKKTVTIIEEETILTNYQNSDLEKYFSNGKTTPIELIVPQKKIILDTPPKEKEIATIEPFEGDQALEDLLNQSSFRTKLEKMIQDSKNLIGTRYKFGSSNQDATYDCSLFAQSRFKQIGITLPRDSLSQSHIGERIDKEDLKIGDLVFFATYRKSPSHVGIYIGDNKFIHAAVKKGITVDSLDQTYYKKRYLFAKRIKPEHKDIDITINDQEPKGGV